MRLTWVLLYYTFMNSENRKNTVTYFIFKHYKTYYKVKYISPLYSLVIYSPKISLQMKKKKTYFVVFCNLEI